MISSFFGSRLSAAQNKAGRLVIISVLSLTILLAAATALTLPVKSAPSGSKAVSASAEKAAVASSTKAGLPKVFDFSAEWCAPCKKFAPIFDKVGNSYKDKVEFVHYDSEKGVGKTLADKYKVNSLPTVIFFDGKGKVILKYEAGIMKEEELVKYTEALLK